MRRFLLAVSMWSALAVTAWAGPLETTASAGPSTSSSKRASGYAWVERSGDETVGSLFDAPIRLDLPTHHLPFTEQSIDLHMGDLLPEGLSLCFRLTPWSTFSVSADLDCELPRLDALDGETYWAPGFSIQVTPELAFFVEDFQPASAIIGSGDEDVAPERSWDGHQVSLGARFATEQIGVEGAVVVYTLSASNRATSTGATLTFSVKF